MTKMTKNENNDSFMRDKNIMRAVDGKRNSHFAWPNFEHLTMAHERKAYSISYQISTHKQVFVTLSSCIGLKRNIGGSVLRAVLQNCHFRVASLP
jgi:hypothetical protein